MSFLETDLRSEVELADWLATQKLYEFSSRRLMRVFFMRESDDPRVACELLVQLAHNRVAEGDIVRAHENLGLALDLAEDNHLYAAWILNEQANLFEADGAHKAASGSLKQAAWRLMEISDQTPEVAALLSTVNAKSTRFKEIGEADPSGGYPVTKATESAE